jgi:dolichol-phosphate mannosyltransferase
MSKTLIFTATYNEFPNIKFLLSKLKNLRLNLDILIIDDSSEDGTLEYLKMYSKNHSFLKLIVRNAKLGLDTAHKIAFAYAKKRKYSNLITMDADLSHDPKVIPKIIKLLKTKNFVIGSRYISGGKCDMKGMRLFLSVFGNLLIKYLLNIKLNEFTTSYRGFNLSKIPKFDLSAVKSSGYSFFMETIFLINKHKISTYEYPIHFKTRFSGKSKIPKLEILRTLFNVIRLKFSN